MKERAPSEGKPGDGGPSFAVQQSAEVHVVFRNTGGIGGIWEFDRSCGGFLICLRFRRRLFLSPTLLVFASTQCLRHGHEQELVQTRDEFMLYLYKVVQLGSLN